MTGCSSTKPENDLVLGGPDGPVRLDHFLHRCFPEISIQQWKKVLANGLVRVNGSQARKGTILTIADSVTLPERLPAALLPGPPLPDPSAQPTIIFADDELLILDKPAGIHTHPLSRSERGTLANWLMSYDPSLAGIGFSPLQPGLVNRLDRDTSGLILVARSGASWEKYRRLFAGKLVTKIYLGIVHGILASPTTVDLPLIHHPGRQEMMTADIPATFNGRQFPAATTIEPLVRTEKTTTVRLTMTTGVTHQLRVHAAAIGHPLVGDLLYGSPETAEPDRKTGRLLLHAHQLLLPDDRTFTAPIEWPAA
ncbi:MAG: RluA family pseudouridine synthase [Deltaproteobacteria bacterium]|nr:RluA family pseudouridine synthase [Candidatus Anaeroferrophillus wilburensis]MBN2889391.1 RluA family pseudouridine synthase [Deltaproteobacteria bacterium]